MYLWGLVCLLALNCGETGRLAVHPRLKNKKRPLEIKATFKANSAADSNGRDERSLGDGRSKVDVTKSILTDDAHGTAYVEWGGTDKNSDVMIVLTKSSGSVPIDSTLYISTDYGKSFNVKKIMIGDNAAILNYIYQSPVNHQKFMLNDVTNKAVVVSQDEGKTWEVHTTTDFTPNVIDHHPTVENLLVAHDTNQQKLYLSKDFGNSFKAILADLNIADFYWGTGSQYDTDGTMFAVANNADGTQAIYSTTDYFASKELIDSAASQFAVIDDFYFYVKKSSHTNHGVNDKDLFISFDRSPALKAKFPPKMADNPTTEFYIADAGEGQAFVIVSHHTNETNLYVSEHKSGNMLLSLERVLYTNQASYDTISWMDGVEPFADFQAIEGLPGVFIASQLDRGTVGHRRIHTVMTYNKGGTWQYVQPPRYDKNGDPTQCFLPRCALHISLMFGINYPNAKHTPLLSRANAPGVIIASGNMGYSHSTINDVFMSSDGGVEWDHVLDGQYHFQILDHGGLVVAARKGEATNQIMYSNDEGVTWYNKTISEVEVNIYGLITEPGEITTVINVYAIEQDHMEWIIFTVDFKKSLGGKCGPMDFVQWSIRDELKSTECVLGKDTKYERKKATSQCYIGSDYNRTIEDIPCPCQASDFECDFLYFRENAGDPCVMMEGVSEDWFIPNDCPPGSHYNRSMGYIKIEGDMCSAGEEKIFSYKKTKCPDKRLNLTITSSAKNNAVQRGTVVTFNAITDGFVDDVYFLWYISDNSSYSGYGSDETQISHNFTKTGSYVVTLNANNGASPVVATTVIQVDDPITNLVLKYEPEDPAVGEGMIFIVTTDDSSRHIDVSRLNYDWNTGAKTYLPILLTSYKTPGRETVTVTVSNSINSKNFTVSFVVNDLTVTNIKAIPVSSSIIQVLWDPPVLRPGLVDSYTLKYRSDGDDSWHKVIVGGNNVTSTNYEISGLQDNTLYDFILVSTSPSGASSGESEVESATTLPLNNMDPATQIKTVPSGDKAKISWTSPGGGCTGFTVEYWMSDRFNAIKSQGTENKATSTTLKNLTPGAPYTVRVIAHYSGNRNSYSAPLNFQIEGTNIADLQEVRGYAVNSTAVVIVWDRPPVHVDGFHVYNASTNKVLTTVTEDQVTISHLQPYTDYLFQVQPFTRSGNEGKKSNTVPLKTEVGVPGPVEQLSCLQKNGAPILTWHEPAKPNGPIANYLIKFDDSLKKSGIPTAVDKNTLSLALTQLPKYKAYKFSVAVQGAKFISAPAFTSCIAESVSGAPGPVAGLYVAQRHISSIDIVWRPPIETGTALTYEIRYGETRGSVRIGIEHVMTTKDKSATITENISPSTEYMITVSARNGKGTGLPQNITAVTLTPPIGSREYEFQFKTEGLDKNNFDNFASGLKEKIVQVTKISRGRLMGVGITHSDTSSTKVSVWIVPRDVPDDKVEPSTEAVIAALDSSIKKKQFVVGVNTAISGGVDSVVAANTGSHSDVAEIVIPGICGLLIVVLVAGLLYYRNRYNLLLRRYSFRSRYANDDNDDVNMIECADEPEGAVGSDLGRGALAISSEDAQQRPRGIKNFFERFNYTAVDQNEPDELIDDDEEHLLPL